VILAMYYAVVDTLDSFPMTFGISQDVFFRQLSVPVVSFLSTPIPRSTLSNAFANNQVDTLNHFLQIFSSQTSFPFDVYNPDSVSQAWSRVAEDNNGLVSQFYDSDAITSLLSPLVQAIQPTPTTLSTLHTYIQAVKDLVCKPFVDTLFPAITFPETIFSDFSKTLNKTMNKSVQNVFDHVNFSHFIEKTISAADALENPEQVVALGDPGTIFTYPLSKKYDVDKLNAYCKSGKFYYIADNLQTIGDVAHFMCL